LGKLLYIQASPRGARSVSTAIADAFVAAYRKARPADEVKTVNLFTADLPPVRRVCAGCQVRHPQRTEWPWPSRRWGLPT